MRLGVVTFVALCVLTLPSALGELEPIGALGATGSSSAEGAARGAVPKPRIRFVYAGVGSTASSLVVGGAIDTGGLPTTYVIEYGTGTQYGSSTGPRALPATSSGGGTAIEVRTTLTGLAPETRYHYRLVATNSAGSTASQNRTIVTGGKAPRFSGAFVRPGPSPTSIVLGATVDTGGLVTAARAECGGRVRSTDVILPATPSLGWSPTRREVRFPLANLAAGKHYACRLLAFNEAGSTAYQRDVDAGKRPRGVQFPAVAGGRTPLAAVISATIDTEGLPTTYRVEYGPDIRYGSRTPTRRLRARPGRGWTPTTAEIRVPLSGLRPASTYYYRIVATNAEGTRSVRRSFVTDGAKPAVSYSYVAPGSTATSAVFAAAVDTGGLPTAVRVEYGSSVAYGSATAPRELSALPTPESFRPTVGETRSEEVEARSGTVHYRVVATNAVGTTSSSDRTYAVR